MKKIIVFYLLTILSISAFSQEAKYIDTSWEFSRKDGTLLCKELTLKKDGVVEGYNHPNEHSWGVENGKLVFYNIDGNPSCRFNDEKKIGGKLELSGHFIFNKKIIHVLKEALSTKCNQSQPQLVGYYPFNGNAQDESGFGNDARVFKATLVDDRFGNPKSAYEFNGRNSFIKIADVNTLNTFPISISTWVKPIKRETVSQRHLSSKLKFPNNVISNDRPNHHGHGFGLNVWDGGSELAVEYHTGFKTLPLELHENQWYHVALIYVESKFHLYVDGDLVTTHDYKQQIVDGLNHILIGRVNNDPNWGEHLYFRGIIDDVKIFDCILTKEQIKTQAKENAFVSKKIEDREVQIKSKMKIKNKKLKVIYWDDSKEDGDIISLNFNEKWVLKDELLTNKKKSIDIELIDNEGVFILFAETTGEIFPNTVAIEIDDGVKVQKVRLSSNLSSSQAIEIRYED